MNTFKIYDLHTDILTEKMAYSKKLDLLKNVKKSGNRSINAIFNDNFSWQKAKNIASVFALKLGFEVAFENCYYPDFLNDRYGNGFNDQKINLLAKELMKFKPAYLSLTWNGQNEFASGCACDGEITSVGLKFIDEVNRLGGVLDCSHLNERGFYQMIERGERVICSHTAFSFVFPHRRNLNEDQIRAILKRGGIVGLVAVGHFLTGAKGSIRAYESAFNEHIDGFLQKFGDRGLSLATDFYGSDAPVFLEGNYNFVETLANGLLSRGISEKVVKNILYNNASDYFEKNRSKV